MFVTFFDSNIKQRMVNYTLYQLNLNYLIENNIDENNTIDSFIDNPYGLIMKPRIIFLKIISFLVLDINNLGLFV